MVECNATGVRTVERTKGNIGPTPPTLLYTIDRHPDPANKHGILNWRGTVDAPQAGATGKTTTRVPRMLAMTRHWLHDKLKDGPQAAADLIRDANKERISESTLRRAKTGYVIAFKEGERWYWALDTAAPVGEGAHDPELDNVLHEPV
jgi:hypothetical protein